jgi:hypothetical protein
MCIEKDGQLIATYIVDRASPDRLAVPFFAVASSTLGRTAARHYGEAIVGVAAAEGRNLVHVGDVDPRVAEALAELGFSKEAGGWMKLALPVTMAPEEAAIEVERVGNGAPPAAELARRVADELRTMGSRPGLVRARALAVERALWPAKLTSTGLACYLVPIQPRWAKELFDHELAEGTLFGANPRLALSPENVYYRAPGPSVLTAPARVLWYVSNDPRYPQSKAIRASSYIDEIVVGRPKDVFGRFKRLGVYEWSDIYALAKHDVARDVMAFKFSKTELFSKPIPWDAVQDTLRAHTGKGSPLQSPITISEECFFDIYARGTRADAA